MPCFVLIQPQEGPAWMAPLICDFFFKVNASFLPLSQERQNGPAWPLVAIPDIQKKII